MILVPFTILFALIDYMSIHSFITSIVHELDLLEVA